MRCATWLCGSLRSPNTIASVGHTCWQAVLISPSRIGSPPLPAAFLTAGILCTNGLRFASPRRDRGGTAGFGPSRPAELAQWEPLLSQLGEFYDFNRRTVYGELLA